MPILTPTLRTARLLLRPFTEADTEAIFAVFSNPRVVRYWDAPAWTERAQAERFIATCKQMEKEGSGARLALERAADGVFIGQCSLFGWNPTYRSAGMGYCLHDAVWGQGFATEAAGALREDCIVNGEVSGSWVYGLLKREWMRPPESQPAVA